MEKKYNLCFFWLLVLSVFAHNIIYAQKLYQERLYEPVILIGGIVSSLYGFPIDEIHAYSYFSDTQTWTKIPFQIDERVLLPDIFENDRSRHYYFFPDTIAAFDNDDELVFLVRDSGDRAGPRAWIDNDEAKTFDRLELKIYDPEAAEKTAYVYIFRSSTITEPVPTPYGFQYVPEIDKIETNYYSVRMNWDHGLINDIVIKPPFGNGIDIFDTQKFRFVGVLDFFGFPFYLGLSGGIAGNEKDNLYIYRETRDEDADYYYLKYTQQPVVRFMREARHTIRFGTAILHELGFYLNAKFYPFSVTSEGGAALDYESLKSDFPDTDDPYVELNLLRQSWDFNANSSGMFFYNKKNNGLLIDGIYETPDSTIDLPIKEWTLVTGNQGSMFTYTTLIDTAWDDVVLYFYDNKNGGQGDGTLIDGGDTGDSLSYGDNGILLRNTGANSPSLELGFSAYFLPKNLTKADAEQMAYFTEFPVEVTNEIQTDVISTKTPEIIPQKFDLLQNYPNPFNPETEISFAVPKKSNVKIAVLNILGQQIRVLTDKSYSPGSYKVKWDGKDKNGEGVPSGIYFYQMKTKNTKFSRRMVLLR